MDFLFIWRFSADKIVISTVLDIVICQYEWELMFQRVGEKEMVKRKLRTSEIRIKPPIQCHLFETCLVDLQMSPLTVLSEKKLGVREERRGMSYLTYFRIQKPTYCKVESNARKFPSFPLDHLLTSVSRVSANLCRVSHWTKQQNV